MAALVAYNFTLNYRPGKINVDADALSRIPWDREQVVDPGTVRHLLGTVITKAGCVIEWLHRTHSNSSRACAQDGTQ